MGNVILQATDWPELSRRQREILGLIISGLSNKEIGRALRISHRTVEAHRQCVKYKLQLHGTASLLHEYYARTRRAALVNAAYLNSFAAAQTGELSFGETGQGNSPTPQAPNRAPAHPRSPPGG